MVGQILILIWQPHEKLSYLWQSPNSNHLHSRGIHFVCLYLTSQSESLSEIAFGQTQTFKQHLMIMQNQDKNNLEIKYWA